MTHDNNSTWANLLTLLRRAMGLHPLTPNEADIEYTNAPSEPIADDEVDSVVAAVLSGTVCHKRSTFNVDLTMALDAGVHEDVLQLNRNAGRLGSDTELLLQDLRRKVLLENDATTETECPRMDDGADPTRKGQ